jgi:hypothetical protein
MHDNYKYEVFIRTSSGRAIENLVMDRYEREVLIPRNKRFYVRSRGPAPGGRIRIELEEVP